MEIKFQPLYSRVLVKPADPTEVTAGGIFIPTAHSEKPDRGKVIAAGEGRYDAISKSTIPMKVGVGDDVIYQHYAGHPIQFGDIELICMEEEEILGIVK